MSEPIVEILQRQNKQLRERVAELDEEIRQLRESHFAPVAPLPSWLPRLTRTEERVLVALRDSRADFCSKDWLMQAIYESTEYDKEPPDIKIIDVWMHKLRTRLSGTPIEIITGWGRGYALTDKSKELLRVSAPLTIAAAS